MKSLTKILSHKLEQKMCHYKRGTTISLSNTYILCKTLPEKLPAKISITFTCGLIGIPFNRTVNTAELNNRY